MEVQQPTHMYWLGRGVVPKNLLPLSKRIKPGTPNAWIRKKSCAMLTNSGSGTNWFKILPEYHHTSIKGTIVASIRRVARWKYTPTIFLLPDPYAWEQNVSKLVAMPWNTANPVMLKVQMANEHAANSLAPNRPAAYTDVMEKTYCKTNDTTNGKLDLVRCLSSSFGVESSSLVSFTIAS